MTTETGHQTTKDQSMRACLELISIASGDQMIENTQAVFQQVAKCLEVAKTSMSLWRLVMLLLRCITIAYFTPNQQCWIRKYFGHVCLMIPDGFIFGLLDNGMFSLGCICGGLWGLLAKRLATWIHLLSYQMVLSVLTQYRCFCSLVTSQMVRIWFMVLFLVALSFLTLYTFIEKYKNSWHLLAYSIIYL